MGMYGDLDPQAGLSHTNLGAQILDAYFAATCGEGRCMRGWASWVDILM